MRRWGDRRDARKVRDVDAMHYIMPLMYPNRCDNEAHMTMDIDLDLLEGFIKDRNRERTGDPYTAFGVIIAGIIKVLYKRPKMNRFYANKNLYQRDKASIAFVVKKDWNDDGEETLARIDADEKEGLDAIQKKVDEQIRLCKTQEDESTQSMNFIKKLPFKRLIGWLARFADRHGWMPKSVIATDPYQCSVVLTNLGSIGMNIGYHHLTNWGTTSLFVVVGKKLVVNRVDENGNTTRRRIMKLSFTIDERIADGFYYAKSLRLLKKYLEHPELME